MVEEDISNSLKRKQSTEAHAIKNEPKESESVLRESDRRLQLVADTAPILIWVSGPEKNALFLMKAG